ncbi:alpha-N-acetylgalactosaminidase-like isoform X4 [Asterias rubens]|uniref:alpha-N-acetylgalactosaminidase-like isoform X4 n=1 Tax=Asterias rubens TaxID=7604 RepID=UPI001455BA57|nr:alpha-N-acetylgalactosaminidase-like isoform X4 [Asterias rubens]
MWLDIFSIASAIDKVNMLAVALLMLCAVSTQALDNGLGRTPPMGWMTWERFRCNTDCKNDPYNCVSEKLVMQMADRMVEDGYKDAGYQYINIDDCWSNKQRDAQGRLQSDPVRFPSGIKALADYVHSRGLKFGIYGDYGTKTCGGYPGSLNHLELDAQTFASWGVDSLKLDGCYSNVSTMKTGYPEMTKYLNATGRPILFSCSWPDYERAFHIPINYTSVADNCNIWRNYNDIQDSWDSVTGIIKYYGDNQKTLVPVAGPGHFNDPDMLIIGNKGLNVNQSNAQMAMWAIFAAPLLMSNDLRNIQPVYRDILLNKEVIRINQDPAGKMGKKMLEFGSVEVWLRPLQYYEEWAIVFLNQDTKIQTVTLKLSQLGFSYMMGYELREILTHKEVGHVDRHQELNFTVPALGALMYYAYDSS